MEIHLRTNRFCIETAARKTYEKLLKQCFRTRVEGKTRNLLETQVEGLIIFLEQTEMRTLRTLYPELDKGGDADVVLEVDVALAEMTLTFNEVKISPPRKSAFAKQATS